VHLVLLEILKTLQTRVATANTGPTMSRIRRRPGWLDIWLCHCAPI